MGRPKGSKNKPKTAPPKAKAKAKRRAPTRVSKPDTPPDWLRKAMAVKPTKPKVGRKPNVIKQKFKAIATKGRRHMAISKDKPTYDPLDDPDFRAGSKMEQLPAEEQVKVPEEKRQQMKGTKLTEEQEPEPAPLFDEVAAGAEIPWENVQALIASTLGGGGDAHASADACVRRMQNDANWVINKGADGTPAGLAIKARKEAEEKARKEREAEAKGRDKAKGKDARK